MTGVGRQTAECDPSTSVNGFKVRRELTGRPVGSNVDNLDPDPVPSARMVGRDLKDSERDLMPTLLASAVTHS
jgi:hypothetical protein